MPVKGTNRVFAMWYTRYETEAGNYVPGPYGGAWGFGEGAHPNPVAGADYPEGPNAIGVSAARNQCHAEISSLQDREGYDAEGFLLIAVYGEDADDTDNPLPAEYRTPFVLEELDNVENHTKKLIAAANRGGGGDVLSRLGPMQLPQDIIL